MTWVVSLVGALLVGLVLWDVFQTLWYPSAQGRLSRALMMGTWRLTGRLGRGARKRSGPLALVAVIGAWGALVVVGGALVYWPHVPTAFTYGPGVVPDDGAELLEALYLSLVSVATLGFGDVVPTVGWLRAAVPLQALIGFALLTAAVSWVLQVYPALNRRRTLSLHLAALREAGTLEALGALTGVTAARILGTLATSLTKVRVDLTQYSETYYFQDESPEAVLGLQVGYAHDLAEAGARSADPDVRHAAAVLTESIADLARVIGAQFVDAADGTVAVLEAYAADQRRGR
ncbi:potassium channel family protein [Georgenia sp. MJ206]|uniref:potassium channel family protein n=1 Tax=Georgenia wangjunii TaxID=3117730 RepID=UPI002F268BC9